MGKAGPMAMRADICRESPHGPWRVAVCQWINTSDRHAPATRFLLPDTYPTEAEAEGGGECLS